jgi:hypothetical protein
VRLPVEAVTPQHLKDAEGIWAIDAHGMGVLHVWGHDSDCLTTIEVIVDRQNTEQLLRLAELVRSIKGPLSPVAELLLAPPETG